MAISIAILGSVLADTFTRHMPAAAPAPARANIGAAFQLGWGSAAKSAFTTAMHFGSWISAAFALAASVGGLFLLRTPRQAVVEQGQPVQV
jgi:hypothetical protein